MLTLTKEMRSLESVFRSLEDKAEKRETKAEELKAKATMDRRKMTPAEERELRRLRAEVVELQVLKNRTADLMGLIG